MCILAKRWLMGLHLRTSMPAGVGNFYVDKKSAFLRSFAAAGRGRDEGEGSGQGGETESAWCVHTAADAAAAHLHE